MNRPIDQAMDARRPAKEAMRALWLSEIQRHALQDNGFPLYMTLPGAEGIDIAMLAEAGLVQLTESGAIAENHKERIIAVERSLPAVLSLQQKFAGLKIIRTEIRDLLAGDNPLRFPQGDQERYCRARVINLDFDKSLSALEKDAVVEFPLMQWIDKLARIHGVAPRTEWSLFLTLNGTMNVSANAGETIRLFLKENFQRSPEFSQQCRRIFGEGLFELLNGDQSVDFSVMNAEDQQKVLMAFVPKKIAQLVHGHGWLVRTMRNLMYGGAGAAPMVSWIFNMLWDERFVATPDQIYRESLQDILNAAGRINEHGEIE